MPISRATIDNFKLTMQYVSEHGTSFPKAAEALSIPKTSVYTLHRALNNGTFDRKEAGVTAAEHKELLALAAVSGAPSKASPKAEDPKAPRIESVRKNRKHNQNGQLLCLAGDAESVIKAMRKMDFSKIVGS